MFGPENSGKTSLVETLFDEQFNHNESTEEVDVQIRTIYANNWKRCTLQEMTNELQRRFLHTLNSAAEMKSSSLKATLATNTTQATSTLQERLVAATKHQKAPEVKPEVIKQAKAIKIINKDEFTAVVWDYVGQIQYLSTHSVFVRKSTVVFIVIKATCLIELRPADKELGTSVKKTYFESIHYWFQSVTSVCQEKGGAPYKSMFLPTIVLVFTHMDEIPADITEQVKEEIISQLEKELKGKPYAKHLAGNLPGVGLLNALKKHCIFLSNKVRNQNIIAQLKEIVLEISVPFMKEKHPLIYQMIEKELLLQEKPVITTTDFHKVAVENGFMAEENSEEMKGALDYFHHKGVILHFPSITNLKHLVFLSPQWLEKFIAFLIVAHHYKSTGDRDDYSYDLLKGEGILVESFLKSMLQMFYKLHGEGGCEISFDEAVTFLKKFGFIAEISTATEFLEEQHSWNKEEGERVFIVPSQLPEDKGTKRLSFVNKRHAWCIHFVFPDGFLSLAFFHQVVASCINWNGQRKQNIAW